MTNLIIKKYLIVKILAPKSKQEFCCAFTDILYQIRLMETKDILLEMKNLKNVIGENSDLTHKKVKMAVLSNPAIIRSQVSHCLTYHF